MSSGNNSDVEVKKETTTDDIKIRPKVGLQPSDSSCEVANASPAKNLSFEPEPAVVERTKALKKKKQSRETASLFSSTSSRIFKFRKASSIHAVGHYRKKSGVTTYKETPTNTLMSSIQLGLHHAIGGLASKPVLDLLMTHFGTIDNQDFPSDGSSQTPAHEYGDYTFKVYAPLAFRHFRSQFGIDVSDFMISICNEKLRELGNPGASGSVFYLTHDDEFIIKTVQRKESKFLQHLLPGYYMNLIQNKQTLLPKFFGLYCYENFLHRHSIRMVVMNNLLPSSIFYHEKYDLKGSTYKRYASEKEMQNKSPTLKDLDFLRLNPNGLILMPDVHQSLMQSIHRDTTLLESFEIMDYSMLVGVHNVDEELRCTGAKDTKLELQPTESATVMAAVGAKLSISSAEGLTVPPVRSYSASAGDHSHLAESDQGSVASSDEASPFPSEHSLLDGPLPVPVVPPDNGDARRETYAIFSQAKCDMFKDVEYHVPPGGIPARNLKGDRLLLFVGIIDILQSYRLQKKMEHGLKAVLVDGDTVSVHKPSFYAQRFRNFMMESVFKCAEVSSTRRKSKQMPPDTEPGV